MSGNNLLDIVTIPLKKLANLLFSLAIGMGGTDGTNVASLIVVGVLFIVIIGVITHSSGNIGGLIRKIKDRKK